MGHVCHSNLGRGLFTEDLRLFALVVLRVSTPRSHRDDVEFQRAAADRGRAAGGR